MTKFTRVAGGDVYLSPAKVDAVWPADDGASVVLIGGQTWIVWGTPDEIVKALGTAGKK